MGNKNPPDLSGGFLFLYMLDLKIILWKVLGYASK